jgi:serine/threonine protein phosphatase PrpC
MECRVSAFSRTGGREHNEDACGYVEKNGAVCCVLADGAGGHQGGEVASRICVQTVLDEFVAAPDVSAAALNRMLHDANQAVLRQQDADRQCADMRSTLVVLLFDLYRRAALWGHVGDSRLYLFRSGAIQLRTRDHSLVQSMIDNGVIRQGEEHGHPDANVLFASTGLRDEFQPSILETPVPFDQGDAFLLCSDGVWGVIDDAAIERCLGGAVSSDQWLQCMEEKIGTQMVPGLDNYSAVGVWFGAASDFMQTMPL